METVERLARRIGHSYADRSAFEGERRALSSSTGFLRLYAEVCRLFRAPEDYVDAARDVCAALASDGIAYAEIYVSPEIFGRIGLDAAACLEAVDIGLTAGTSDGGATCAILLDTVRHWGPEAAERVLDLYEKKPLASIRGFGMGGDENALPAAPFAGVYARARALGLKTSVHAGEWSGADSVREALDALRPDRLDHGIAAVEDRELLRRLANEGTVLCVALSGNIVTGAVRELAGHPLKQLVEAGVRVALSADDPLFFSTTTLREYQYVRGAFHFDDRQLTQLAQNAWQAAFCSASFKNQGLAGLGDWLPPGSPQVSGEIS